MVGQSGVGAYPLVDLDDAADIGQAHVRVFLLAGMLEGLGAGLQRIAVLHLAEHDGERGGGTEVGSVHLDVFLEIHVILVFKTLPVLIRAPPDEVNVKLRVCNFNAVKFH